MTCGKKTRHTGRIGCCPLCGELFNSDSAHNRHRTKVDATGRRGCVHPSEVGMVAKPSRTAPGEVIWSAPIGDNPWASDERG